MNHHKKVLLSASEYGLQYADAKTPVFSNLSFKLQQGDRVFLSGKNGCGKSSFIKAILAKITNNQEQTKNMIEGGSLETASGLIISYINQDTSILRGDIKEFCRNRNFDESLFCAILRQLDMERVQFSKNMEEFSEGLKKKVLIAASLLTPAHLYIWDEPLNYIDVFSRMQIEKLLLAYEPTMLVVEHDVKFREKISTKVIEM